MIKQPTSGNNRSLFSRYVQTMLGVDDDDGEDEVIYVERHMVVERKSRVYTGEPLPQATKDAQQAESTPARTVKKVQQAESVEKAVVDSQHESSGAPAKTQAVGRAFRRKPFFLNLAVDEGEESGGDHDVDAPPPLSGHEGCDGSNESAEEVMAVVRGHTLSQLPRQSDSQGSSTAEGVSQDRPPDPRPETRGSQAPQPRRPAPSTAAVAQRPQSDHGQPRAKRQKMAVDRSRPATVGSRKGHSCQGSKPRKPAAVTFNTKVSISSQAADTTSFRVDDRPSHWGGRPMAPAPNSRKRPRHTAASTGRATSVPKSSRSAVSVPSLSRGPVVQRRTTTIAPPNGVKEVSFRPTWMSNEAVEDAKQDREGVSDDDDNGLFDEGALTMDDPTFTSPGPASGRWDGDFKRRLDHFNGSGRKQKRGRYSKEPPGRLSSMLERLRRRTDSAAVRLRSGQYPLSSFLSGGGVRDVGDPRHELKTYLDVRLVEPVKSGVGTELVEGFEVYLATVESAGRFVKDGRKISVEVDEQPAQGAVALLVVRRSACASLDTSSTLRFYDSCVRTCGVLLNKLKEACSPEKRDCVSSVVLTSTLHEILDV